MKKKLLWIGLLIAFIILIVVIVLVVKPLDTTKATSFQKNTNTTNSSTTTNAIATSEISNTTDSTTSDSEITYIKTEESDGILYSVDGEKIDADIIVGDDYFDTTINDMYLNPSDYDGKTIEIEGFYLANDPYTFVGRYSTASLCAYCATGYSYLEYQLQGDISEEFEDSETWLKVVGTLAVGNDETSYYEDYYYLKVLSIEIMNEKGQETVQN